MRCFVFLVFWFAVDPFFAYLVEFDSFMGSGFVDVWECDLLEGGHLELPIPFGVCFLFVGSIV